MFQRYPFIPLAAVKSKFCWNHFLSRFSKHFFYCFCVKKCVTSNSKNNFLLEKVSAPWQIDTKLEVDENFGKWWKSTTWWKVQKVMKVNNVMKSSESDESRQPDEKFGKWWNSTTWWKVGKVMKQKNLMSKHELFKKFRLDEKKAANEKKQKHEKLNLLKIYNYYKNASLTEFLTFQKSSTRFCCWNFKNIYHFSTFRNFHILESCDNFEYLENDIYTQRTVPFKTWLKFWNFQFLPVSDHDLLNLHA